MIIDVVHHPDCMLHDPPFEVTNGRVQQYGESGAAGGDADNADAETLLLAVHDADFIQFLKTIYVEWTRVGQSGPAIAETFAHPGMLLGTDDKKQDPKLHVRGKLGLYNFDLSVAYTQDTYRSAFAAAQVSIAAAKRIVENGQKAVYALCRPPGHHAACNVAGGYCFINNAAVATKYLVNVSPSPSNVLILDLDFHHGNGTQNIFYDDPSVFYVSLHAHPGYYPYFTGSPEEIGTGPGAGLTMNVSLDPKTTDDASYLETLADVLRSPKLASFHPKYIVVSLGVDTWHMDPAGGMQIINKSTYNSIGKTIAQYAQDIPVLFVQEGGLCIDVLGELVSRVLCGFITSNQ
ncbi:hypothetical protein BX666DRAFT_2019341 [Dichotomocladium elegans]|nr:hypothetical protein BX666DRAFT_2019341 [Dichotomocladium elegans]